MYITMHVKYSPLPRILHRSWTNKMDRVRSFSDKKLLYEKNPERICNKRVAVLRVLWNVKSYVQQLARNTVGNKS